jgi:hypothetical protein
VPVLFHTGSAHGIHPSELSPLPRYPERHRPDEPTYRFACRFAHRRATDRPGKPRFLGFNPRESPWRSNAGLGRQPLAAPLGFSPSRAPQQKPCRTPARTPLTRLPPAPADATGDASECQSAPAQPDPPTAASRIGRPDHPSRVFAPARSQHSRKLLSWVLIPLTPRRASLPTRPTFFGQPFLLC